MDPAIYIYTIQDGTHIKAPLTPIPIWGVYGKKPILTELLSVLLTWFHGHSSHGCSKGAGFHEHTLFLVAHCFIQGRDIWRRLINLINGNIVVLAAGL